MRAEKNSNSLYPFQISERDYRIRQQRISHYISLIGYLEKFLWYLSRANIADFGGNGRLSGVSVYLLNVGDLVAVDAVSS